MKKLLTYVKLLLFLAVGLSAYANNDDLGQNYHFEEIKKESRNVAGKPTSVKPVDAPEADDQTNERDIASDLEQAPSHKGVKFWKYEQ